MRGGLQRKEGPSLLQVRKRDHSFSESEEEGAPPLSPSLKESPHSFSEREAGMPITLSLKERVKANHPFSPRKEVEKRLPSLL